MPSTPFLRFLASIVILLSGSALAACSTAATVGDGAIRMASLGRVQATPLADFGAAKDCRTALTEVYGFPRESRGMKNGVFVVQSFGCRGDQITAKVRMTNHTDEPMYCFAETDNTRPGVWIAPKSGGFFEYAYSESAFQDCRTTG